MSCKHGNWAPCELCDAESALETRIEELELERDALLEQLESARANARLIAACDPDTIRALLGEREALVAKVERDEALLRQALTALEQIATDLPWELTGPQADAIAALRERLSKGA